MRYPPSELSPPARAQQLRRISGEVLDVLVIGGGVTGAGVALDAASRGLRTGLVEAVDWAAGTSSRSSKLVHGGLRYLQMLDFHLVHEGLRERSLLLGRLAPHLVRPVPILYPLHTPVLERLAVGAGVGLYDLMGGAVARFGGTGALPWHRHLSRAQALATAPALRPSALTGAVLYHDGQVDDARFVTELVRTAALYGAAVVNRARATGLLTRQGRVVGARVVDTESGQEHEVAARVVVSATGVWSEDTEDLAGQGRAVRVRPSKGAHLVVPADRVDSRAGLILRTETSVLFVLPWQGRWVIGTTDTDWPYDKSCPLPTAADVDYILARVNGVLRRPLGRGDVTGAFAGLRPLVAGEGVVRGPGESGGDSREAGATARLSREHAVGCPAPGFVVVSGGKYTTYRVMAADAVDAAVREAGLTAPASRTRAIPLLGARHFAQVMVDGGPCAGQPWPDDAGTEHLLHRYGGQVGEVLGLSSENPSLGAPLGAACGRPTRYLRAEVVHAVTHEGALHLDDVMARRTRLAVEEPGGAADLAAEVASLMAPALRWGPATVAEEIRRYRQGAELLARAVGAPDDAAAARLAASEP